jgi:hypothetical protein
MGMGLPLEGLCFCKKKKKIEKKEKKKKKICKFFEIVFILNHF